MDRPPTTPSSVKRPPRRIAILTHSYYEEDPRVRRQAEALAAAGDTIEVFALRRPADPERETIDGVNVRRLGVQRHQGASLAVYLREYLSFFVRSGLALTRAHAGRRFGLVQVHTLPDFLVFATLPLRLTGVPVILDMHEAMPEFFASRFRGRTGWLGRILVAAQERAAVRFASAVVTVNDALGDRLTRMGVPSSKVTIIRNVPSLARFVPAEHPNRPFMMDGTLRLVYAGALSPIYELDVVLDAIAVLAKLRPSLEITLDLYGRDFDEVPLHDQAIRLGIVDRVRFHGRIPIAAVPAAIAAGDVGLAPTRRTPFTDYSLSTKIFEYAAMGRPVIATNLPMVTRTFDEDVLTYVPGDPEDLARAMLCLVDEPEERAARVGRARHRLQDLSWETESARLFALVDALGRGD
jgi:glycosyltransferase involved in cell wall biosynthesis